MRPLKSINGSASWRSRIVMRSPSSGRAIVDRGQGNNPPFQQVFWHCGIGGQGGKFGQSRNLIRGGGHEVAPQRQDQVRHLLGAAGAQNIISGAIG